ncbi:hypothetical protein [Streptomyces sp. JH34]|uniref:hypothetical protein n=1 Tax=Streptomyces sp. JH34 TaxID=2793633 RepID=UPI0023F8CF65|nr:hypothetical protein [Streptomyces sp. JH34]MDF6019587.1 hypothetical protein [Streptomyces sp. JH34]
MITAVATITAAVIAAVASGGDSPSDALRAGPPATSVTAPASTEEAGASEGPSDGPSDPPLQTLPATGTPARASKPRVSVTPYMAAAGDTVTIEASGFAPGERVRITFTDSGSVEKDVRDVTAEPDGRLAVEVRVPVEVGSGHDSPMFRVWSVDDVDANNTADTPFTYTE